MTNPRDAGAPLGTTPSVTVGSGGDERRNSKTIDLRGFDGANATHVTNELLLKAARTELRLIPL
jgi:hypothetical protein